MTREEAREFLINISYKLGNMSVEYLSEKDGEKMREAIKALDQEPVIDNTEQCMKAMKATDRLQRWIPVSERLPEGFEPVLFTSKNGEIAIGYRDPRFKTYWACIDRADWHHTDFDVIAWMPLPEPYQEGGKNEHD